ncbi:MAG: nuclear transport factor 2 family protein [Vicinamibacteraceae bacterium]|nr:nuclear transport factor 2 family protein [Vicinamibacteraceae bacterium]
MNLSMRPRVTVTAIAALIALTLPALSSTALASDEAEKEAVKAVVTEAYVNGVHAKPDAAAMRRGFHPDFRMLVLSDGKMNAVTLDEWAGRIEKAAANPNAKRPAIKAEFPTVEITGTVASVRIELYRDGRHTFTDHLLLYKFADGWKIVSKAFYSHPRPAA